MDPELLKYTKMLVKLTILVLSMLALYLVFVYLLPLLGKVLYALPALFLPFILAVIMAILIEPLVNIFEKRWHLARGLAVFLSLVLVVGGLILMISLLVSKIITELSGLHPFFVSYSDQISRQIVETVAHIKVLYLGLNLPPVLQVAIQGNLEKALTLVQNLLNATLNVAIQALAMLPSAAIFLLIATVGTFLMVKDRALLSNFFLTIIPIQARSKTRNVIAELFNALVGFIKAYSILITITGVLTMIGLRLMGVEYALTLGIAAGLFDILPVLGPGTIFLPWIIWEFSTGDTAMGISLLLLYVIISIVRQFLEPKIVGDNIGLHPLATLVSLYVGLQLGGIFGMIMGPVLVVIVMACYRVGILDSISWRKKS